MSIFEILMLICFGAAWPFSIYRSAKSKSTQGKSFLFSFIIMVGYVFGIINKLYYAYDFVIYLYALNLVMILTDTMIYLRNLKLEMKASVG